jgi:hypothetical protein
MRLFICTQTNTEAKASRFIGHVYALSALVAVWSFAMVYRMSRRPLKHLYVTPKFVCFQLVLLINSIQPAVINILVDTRVIVCEFTPVYLPAQAVANRKLRALSFTVLIFLFFFFDRCVFSSYDD